MSTERPPTDPADEGEGHVRETDVQESDPNADSSEGLAGGMGVSSERVGALRGADQAGTYGTLETHEPAPEPDAVPEQSADPATGPEVHPAQPPLKDHGHQAGT